MTRQSQLEAQGNERCPLAAYCRKRNGTGCDLKCRDDQPFDMERWRGQRDD